MDTPLRVGRLDKGYCRPSRVVLEIVDFGIGVDGVDCEFPDLDLQLCWQLEEAWKGF